MHKSLYILCLISISAFSSAKNGGAVPTKQYRECMNNAHSNMTSLYLCTVENSLYLGKVVEHRLKKINNSHLSHRWNKLKKGAELQCRKELSKLDRQNGLNNDGDINAPDYLALMYECIEDKYSDFNRYFLNERRSLYEK